MYDMRAITFGLLAVLLGVMTTCSDEVQDVEVNCSRAYILLDGAEYREFQRYFPVNQKYGYYFSEYRFTRGGREYVYRFNNVAYVNRTRDFALERGITFDKYMEACDFFPPTADTLFLYLDNGDKFAEFRVSDRYFYESTGDSLFLTTADTTMLLMDYGLADGEVKALNDTARLEVRKVTELGCRKIFQVTRFNGQDSVNNIFISQIGMVQRRDTIMDFRLNQIDNEVMAQIMHSPCD